MNVSVSIFIHRHIIYYFISIYIKLKCPILFLRMSLHFLFYSTLDIQTVFLRPSFTNWKQTTFPMSRHICSVSPNFSFFFFYFYSVRFLIISFIISIYIVIYLHVYILNLLQLLWHFCIQQWSQVTYCSPNLFIKTKKDKYKHCKTWAVMCLIASNYFLRLSTCPKANVTYSRMFCYGNTPLPCVCYCTSFY